MISGIPLVLGLGTRMSDTYVYVVFGAPAIRDHSGLWDRLDLIRVPRYFGETHCPEGPSRPYLRTLVPKTYP